MGLFKDLFIGLFKNLFKIGVVKVNGVVWCGIWNCATRILFGLVGRFLKWWL